MTLPFDFHIKKAIRVTFFHLRKIKKNRPILSLREAETLIHAFMTSRLDYCNVLLSGFPAKSFQGLQMVQNVAACILTESSRFEHICPMLASLHWLPVQVRADFKVLLLTYKIVNGLGPSYLLDFVNIYVPTRFCRSQGSGLLSVPKVKKKTVGERAFSLRAPTLRNGLPLDIRQATSIEVFKARLKTHLFITVNATLVVCLL